MAVVDQPYIPPLSPLRGLASNLYNVKDRLNRLANDIVDVFIIGYHLASPFYWLAYYFEIAGDYCVDADDWMKTLKGRMDGLYDGTVFLALLYWASDNFYQIINDPVNWMRVKIASIGINWMYLMYYPLSFVKVQVALISPHFERLIYNPEYAIYKLLTGYVSWLASFYTSPANFIVNQIKIYLPDIWQFLSSPVNFIYLKLTTIILDFSMFRFNPKWWVFYRLYAINNDIANLINSPSRYVKTQISALFNIPLHYWVNPHYYFLVLFLEKLELYIVPVQEVLKRIIIKIILRFI